MTTRTAPLRPAVLTGRKPASMRSIFRYPGGKSKSSVLEWILSHRPAGVREYREPFVGGGGVFFAVRDVERRWVNDRHPGLVAVYEALRDRPAEFIAACRAVPPARPDDPLTEPGPRNGVRLNARLKAVFDRVAFDEECDQAFRYFFVNRTVFGGRVNYDIPSRVYFSNPEGWNIVETGRLERAAKHLAGARITLGDYAPLLSEPGDGVWVYCDPPYVVNTNLSKTSQLYQHGFTDDDHRAFAAAVRASPHKVCISYDDDDQGFVRSLFPEADGFRVVEGSWAYSGTTNGTKEHGRELLILNYDPPRGAVCLFSEAGGDEDGDDLTEGQAAELERLESVIERCGRSFVQAGQALRAIRDGRLYRTDFKTFGDYCKARWGFTPQHCGRLIASAEVVEQLGLEPIGSILPAHESQARELTRLESAEDRAAAWSAAVHEADGRTPTAALVRKQVKSLLPPEAETEPDWRAMFRRAWKAVPPEDRPAVMGFLTDLLGGVQ